MAMQTSTPNFRRGRDKAFADDNPQFTPLKMRVAPAVNDLLSESNDDIERAERRKSRVLRKSILALPSGVDSPAINESIKGLSEADLKTQLQTFCKLNAENKISTKNAWHIRVIDVLKQIVSKDNPDILKVAGTSLEIAGKVYGLRVDDLHAEGLKLAASLARNFASRGKDDEGSEVPPNGTGEEVQLKKKERKKKRGFMAGETKFTINPDPKGFLAPLPKLESCFFSLRTESALSATDNLFTNKCRMDPSGCKFLFGTDAKVWQWTAGNDKSVSCKKKIPINLKPVQNYKLCGQLKDFRTDNWDPNQEYHDSFKSRSSLEEVVVDANGIPIPELDGSIHDVFNEPDNQDCNDHDSVEEEYAAGLIHQDVEHIVNFLPTETRLSNYSGKSQYSFNNVLDTGRGKIDQIWAGPSHWKLKFIRGRREVYSGKDANTQKVPQKKGAKRKFAAEHVDVWSLLQEELKREEDFPKSHKKVSLKSSCVSDANKYNIPMQERSCIELIENIQYFMTVTTAQPQKKKRDSVEYNVSGYNYDNPNDSNYCPQPQADNGADEGTEFDNSNDAMEVQAFAGDNLVEAPEMIEQIFMKYATKAKKMDMKKLKENVWCLLTQKEKFDPSAKVVQTHFSEMFGGLPNILPENMTKELSCALAFVALLHLCNEQSLELRKQDNDVSDFAILGPM